METQWFYLEGDDRQGPVAVEELIRVLSAAPRPHQVPVWRKGLAEWQVAGSIAEIRDRLPPPPIASVGSDPDASDSFPLAAAEAIARLYRRLVLLVGLQLVLSLIQVPLEQGAESVWLALAVNLGLLAVLVAVAVTTYKLTGRLGEGWPILWAILMFVPCFNLLGLLVLSSKAQRWCKQYGIKVGLLGPTQKSIEEVRRRSFTSEFE